MSVEIKIDCPLGSTCEKAENGVIVRCAWYTKLAGKHPQSEEYVDQWGCAIAWLPVLSVEMSQTNRGQTRALESLRNEVVKDTRSLMQIMLSGRPELTRIEEQDANVSSQ